MSVDIRLDATLGRLLLSCLCNVTSTAPLWLGVLSNWIKLKGQVLSTTLSCISPGRSAPHLNPGTLLRRGFCILQVALPPCRLLRIPRSAYQAALESTRPAGLPLVRSLLLQLACEKAYSPGRISRGCDCTRMLLLGSHSILLSFILSSRNYSRFGMERTCAGRKVGCGGAECGSAVRQLGIRGRQGAAPICTPHAAC